MSNAAYKRLEILVMVVGLIVALGGWVWAASAKSSDIAKATETLIDHEGRIRNVESFRDSTNAKLDDIRESLRRIESRGGNHP